MKETCSRYKKVFRKCLFSYSIDDKDLIKKFAKENNCTFTYNLLDYKNLSNKEKFKFILQALNFLLFNNYPLEKNCMYLSYFSRRSNFGDCLNLYIIQRLFKTNIREAQRTKKADMAAIGSILQRFTCNEFSVKRIFKGKQLNIWGSGFIEEAKYKNEKFFKRTNILALRGEISKARCEKILNRNLAKVKLGDPGLLADKLINTNNINKKYNAGIILHFLDMESPFVKNIQIKNCKYINIMDNPLKILKEIAECEVILSSAMHGLIASDALNIPNQWIILSDKLYGGSYKFKDYYSVYNIKIPRDKVQEIKQGLIEAFPIKKGLAQPSLQAEGQIEGSDLL